jgi:hypothetical protein
MGANRRVCVLRYIRVSLDNECIACQMHSERCPEAEDVHAYLPPNFVRINNCTSNAFVGDWANDAVADVVLLVRLGIVGELVDLGTWDGEKVKSDTLSRLICELLGVEMTVEISMIFAYIARLDYDSSNMILQPWFEDLVDAPL